MQNQQVEHIIEKLFHENFQSLVFTSLNIVKDYEQAKDIVQNVFVKLWQNSEILSRVGNPKSYVFTAVRNSSLNFIRDQKTVVVDLEGKEVISDDEDDNSDKVNQIHQAVNKLPDNWKEAFILSKYEKFKYAEIAEEMNISIKTVEKYISKALAFLRLELKTILIIIFFILFSHKL